MPPLLLTLGHVDLLVHVDLKNNWLVEFSDLKYKSSSNFKSFPTPTIVWAWVGFLAVSVWMCVCLSVRIVEKQARQSGQRCVN